MKNLNYTIIRGKHKNFKKDYVLCAGIAQSVEHFTRNEYIKNHFFLIYTGKKKNCKKRLLQYLPQLEIQSNIK